MVAVEESKVINAEQLLENKILTQLANDIESECSYKSGNEKRIEDNRAKGNWNQTVHARNVNDSSEEIKKHQMNSAPKVPIFKTVCSPLNPYIKKIVSSVKPSSKKEYRPPRIPNIWSSDEWANFKKSIPISNYIIPQHHFYNDQIIFDLAYDYYEKKLHAFYNPTIIDLTDSSSCPPSPPVAFVPGFYPSTQSDLELFSQNKKNYKVQPFPPPCLNPSKITPCSQNFSVKSHDIPSSYSSLITNMSVSSLIQDPTHPASNPSGTS